MCSTYISSYVKHRNVKCRDMTKGMEGSRKSNHPEVLYIFEDPWPHILGSFFVSCDKISEKSQSKGETVSFGSWFCSFLVMVNWLGCFRACNEAEHTASWPGVCVKEGR